MTWKHWGMHCQGCGKRFGSNRSHARFCSGKCKQKAYRRRGAAVWVERTTKKPARVKKKKPKTRTKKRR